MPMIIFIVAIAAVALGGAVYYRSATEATTTPDEVTTEEVETTSNIGVLIDQAERAADAMEQGLGSDSELIDQAEIAAPQHDGVTTYADGAYTKTGTYTSPAGQEDVTVSITLADDVIASATFSGNATNPGSVTNQKKFAEGYTSLVVGKRIDEVALTVVNGSSLTGIGFMDALDAIKDEARL